MKDPKILVLSARDALRYVMSHFCEPGMTEYPENTDTYAAISIQDTISGGFGFELKENEYCKAVLTLYFDDIERPERGLKRMTPGQAKQIVDFIEANKNVPSGTTVNIWVSKGKDPQVSVPEITGKTEAEAKAALEEAGLKVGTVTEKENEAPKGTILSQKIAAGTKVDRDSAVDYEISKGKPETTTEEPTEKATEKTTEKPKEQETPQEVSHKKKYVNITVNKSDLSSISESDYDNALQISIKVSGTTVSSATTTYNNMGGTYKETFSIADTSIAAGTPVTVEIFMGNEKVYSNTGAFSVQER